jgi:hypothetical protein
LIKRVPVEGAGVRAGVTVFDTADGGPVPSRFVAVTVNRYATPFVRPVTVADLATPGTVVVTPPGLAVTV